MDQSLAPFESERFLARRKVLALMGAEIEIFRPDETLAFFVKQKAFKLKEAITVFQDRGQTRPVLTIQARSVMDFRATYDVATPDGTKIGALKREGMRSMLRDKWLIMDVNDAVVGEIEEDSMMFALLRRFMSNLIPQSFDITMGGNQVAVFKQHFNPFVAKFDIDFSKDTAKLLDRRIGIAAVVLLLAIEGRQR